MISPEGCSFFKRDSLETALLVLESYACMV